MKYVFLWLLVSCVSKKRVPSMQDSCESQSIYAWVEGACVRKDSLIYLKNACESQKGTLWKDGYCQTLESSRCPDGIGFCTTERPNSEKTCLDQGGLWKKGFCLTPLEAQNLCENPSSFECEQEISCLAKGDGSQWNALEKRCMTPQEVRCFGEWKSGQCFPKTFLSYCKQPENQEILKTVEALREFLGEKTSTPCEILDQKLSAVTHLKVLKKELSHLGPLSSLVQLKNLELSNNNIVDLSPLWFLTKLENLDLAYNEVSDLSPLAPLEELTVLRLDHNKISKIHDLLPLNRLNHLSLESNDIENLDFLVAETSSSRDPWPYLTVLTLNGNCKLKNLSPLLKCPQITYLNLNSIGASQLPDFLKNTPNVSFSSCTQLEPPS